MFTEKTPSAPTKLDNVIDALLTKMADVDCTSDEYGKMADQLVKLYKVRELDTNYKVKELEILIKQEDTAKTHEIKERETLMKQQQLENEKQLREEELTLKERETEANVRLREAETNLKIKDVVTPDRVSKDTLAIIGANLAGIVLIIGYEKFNVVTSKALGFIQKLR
jgi:hypothetical protein